MVLLPLLACFEAPPEPIVVTFSLNVHDWGLHEESAAAVERALDLHEELGVPVDVFLTDAVARRYAEEHPHVIERLRASPVAAVSYHVRPPHPYYPGFDWYGLDALDADARYAVLAQYETHAVDLADGHPTPAPGGYAFVRDLVGYPPWAVGPSVTSTMSGLLDELGATFEVDHEATHDLGATEDDLYLRPEHVEVKLYEWEGADACAVIADHVAAGASPASGPRVVNVKWHENDLYAKETTWRRVYYEDGDAERPIAPPWDPEAWVDDVRPTGATVQVERWELYRAGLECVADPTAWTPKNLRDLAADLAEMR